MAERSRFKHLAQGTQARRERVGANLGAWTRPAEVVQAERGEVQLLLIVICIDPAEMAQAERALEEPVTVALGESGTWHMPRGFKKAGLAAASLAAAASAFFYGGGPRVGEARVSRPNIEPQRSAEQVTRLRILDDPAMRYFDVALWEDSSKASTLQELIDAYHGERPAKMAQSAWLISVAGDAVEEGFIPGAPPFASKLKEIPAGRQVVVVANRRPVETPLPPSGQATPVATPGGSEKFPPPTQGSDMPQPEATPKPRLIERVTEAQVDALAAEVDRLIQTGGFPLTEHYQIIDGRVVPLDQKPIWRGLRDKRVDERLGAATKAYLRWLHANRKWGHGLDGRSSSERVRDYGYTGNTREILAPFPLFDNDEQLPSAMEILLGWLTSPEHQDIIKDPSRPDFKISCILVEVVGVDNKGRPTPPAPSLYCGGLFGRQAGK